MTTQTWGIIIGGILPAFAFGIAGTLQKSAIKAGIGTGPYLFFLAVGVAAASAAVFVFQQDKTLSTRSALFATGIGIFFATGMGLVSVALHRFNAPLSTLVPLYNMNTLVAVLLALVIFAEWKDISTAKLLAGTLLIVAGGILVSNA